MAYWLLVGGYNGIYSSSPNGKIDEDLEIVRGKKKRFPLDALLKAMKDRPPRSNSIDRASLVDERFNVLRGRTGREYLMLLDVLLHRNQATDWAGRNLVSESAAIHHVFPREYLKDCGETRDEYINCLGNLALIDPAINSEIGDTPPEEYLKGYSKSGVFAQHFIPDDPKLWKFDSYDRFLDSRLKLMWSAARTMLEELAG
jgi:hypothetical protein